MHNDNKDFVSSHKAKASSIQKEQFRIVFFLSKRSRVRDVFYKWRKLRTIVNIQFADHPNLVQEHRDNSCRRPQNEKKSTYGRVVRRNLLLSQYTYSQAHN